MSSRSRMTDWLSLRLLRRHTEIAALFGLALFCHFVGPTSSTGLPFGRWSLALESLLFSIWLRSAISRIRDSPLALKIDPTFNSGSFCHLARSCTTDWLSLRPLRRCTEIAALFGLALFCHFVGPTSSTGLPSGRWSLALKSLLFSIWLCSAISFDRLMRRMTRRTSGSTGRTIGPAPRVRSFCHDRLSESLVAARFNVAARTIGEPQRSVQFRLALIRA